MFEPLPLGRRCRTQRSSTNSFYPRAPHPHAQTQVSHTFPDFRVHIPNTTRTVTEDCGDNKDLESWGVSFFCLHEHTSHTECCDVHRAPIHFSPPSRSSRHAEVNKHTIHFKNPQAKPFFYGATNGRYVARQRGVCPEALSCNERCLGAESGEAARRRERNAWGEQRASQDCSELWRRERDTDKTKVPSRRWERKKETRKEGRKERKEAVEEKGNLTWQLPD